MNILLLNGPNLQLLGTREPEIYGSIRLSDIVDEVVELGKELNCEVTAYQSNIEGELVSLIGSARQNGFDGIILNAGAYKIPRSKGKNGFENVFNINFVSPYILATALLPQIKERGGRVVAVGSIAHNYSKIDLDDVDFSTRRAPSKIYGNAKRYLMFSLWGLDEYCGALSVAHPGIAVTNITSHYPRVLYAVMKPIMKLIFMSPKKACLSILYALFTDTQKNEWIGPWLFDVGGLPKKKTLKTCSQEEAEQICKTTKEII